MGVRYLSGDPRSTPAYRLQAINLAASFFRLDPAVVIRVHNVTDSAGKVTEAFLDFNGERK